MSGLLHIGTSGFAYPEWKGDFYPADMRPDAMLRFYAERFPSVEINYTFQRELSEKTIAKWIADTPEGFAFSLKAHRAITHNLRLKPEAADPLGEFLATVAPLGAKVGAILFQCPPNFKMDLERLRTFLALLPDSARYAFEFRHESCRSEEVLDALAERGVAWCVADADDYEAPFVRTAPGFAYVRLRKTVYEDEALSRWAKQIGETLAEGVDVYCYLKHEDEGRGVHFARRLMELIEASGEPSPAPEEPASEPFPPGSSAGPERT
jgi:uncharacterized protein YecE (DUF72 family)